MFLIYQISENCDYDFVFQYSSSVLLWGESYDYDFIFQYSFSVSLWGRKVVILNYSEQCLFKDTLEMKAG